MTFSQFEEQITPGTSNLQPGTVHSVATPYPTASWLQLFVLSGSAQPCARAHITQQQTLVCNQTHLV